MWNIIQTMRNDLYAYVMANLDARRISLARVSREAGIPYESLKKIAHRRTPNPGVKHVQALADYFDGRSAGVGVVEAAHLDVGRVA